MSEMPSALIKPVPDPSTLTTEQLLREIDRVIALMQAEMIGGWGLRDAKFDAIAAEFRMIESRRVEQKIDTKGAVDTALANSDKAVTNALTAADKAFREQTSTLEKAIIKSETSSVEQSKQQNATLTTSIAAVTNIVADLKERVNRIENQRLGALENRSTQRQDSGVMLSVGFFLIALVSIGITIITAMMK